MFFGRITFFGRFKSGSGTMPARPMPTLTTDRLPEALQEEVQKNLASQTQLFNQVNQEFQKLQNQLQAVTRERDQLRQQNIALNAKLANNTAVDDKNRAPGGGDAVYSSIGSIPHINDRSAAFFSKIALASPQSHCLQSMRAVTTFALFTAVSASCAENPSLPECAARGSELLQKHAGFTSRGAGLQLDATRLMTFEALRQKTAESFARARELQKRSRLLIERSDLVAKHKAKSFRRDGTCLENAREGFHHFLDSSGLGGELTDMEILAFEERFMEEMQVLCKHHGTDTIPDHQQQAAVWLEDLMAAIQDEMPVLSERLLHVLQAEASYTVQFSEWLANFSAADLRRRTGIRHDEQTVNASMLQTQSITENIRTVAVGGHGRPVGRAVGTRSLPASFEAASEWPSCAEIIMRIHNQGQCGSCWSFAATSALDSRLCIATNGAFSGPAAQLSRGFVASCAPPSSDGCAGGWSDWVFNLMATTGVPTGGSLGCHPYFAHGDGTEHFSVSGVAPPCPTQCGNSNFGRSMADDKFKLGTSNYITIASYQHPFPERVYHLAREALLSGPIPAYLYADSGFMAYSSGIYTHGCASYANHAITVVGYGPDYWNCLNSWGPWWGDGGTFKVGLCVLTDFQIPSTSLAGDSAGYSFPLAGSSATPAPGLNPAAEYSSVAEAYSYASPWTKDLREPLGKPWKIAEKKEI
eukprot:s1597_g9.t1